ncbi:polyisoprenoid-binding protein [Marinicauda salina]|uniref:Polyisoprenoid-binding protein n=1 Tax=Marinicauda salina TaxID=2135793 RepID=A0A2U2BQR5_9PROT|nr:YceI family protein [Marinicauda salina]PWE16357.1 polyisoprenoid-binding protein [Marinicauda salina]
MKFAYAAASLAAFLMAPTMSTAAFAEPAEYEFDKSHTTIRASWTHLGYSRQSLHFTDYDGVLMLDFEEPENSTVDVTFTLPGGLWAGGDHERFIEHLNSGDFFLTEEHPEARFVATGFATEDGETGTMTGDLTIRGVTNEVTLDVELNKHAPKPESMGGTMTAGFSATGTVNRSDWDMGYAVPAVSDEVEIVIETELTLVSDEDA